MTNMIWGTVAYTLIFNGVVVNEYCSYNILTIFNRADAVVDPWLENLWQKILQLYPLAAGLSVIPYTVQYVGLLVMVTINCYKFKFTVALLFTVNCHFVQIIQQAFSKIQCAIC